MNDFEHLLEPYSERQADGNALRTVAGQMRWLLGKGFDAGLAQLAIARVYFELSGGKTFSADDQHSAGYYLDRYLLDTALSIRQDAETAMVKAAADKLQMLIQEAIFLNRRQNKTEQATEPIKEQTSKKHPWYKLWL